MKIQILMLNQNFTTMKKLIFLVCLLTGVGISANVMAQSTGTAPYPGATHSYKVTENAGSTYAWSVTEGNLTTSAGTDATLSSTSGDSISIKWASTVVADDVYYVHVVETVTETSCTNEKVLKVTIAANGFYAVIAADAATACYDAAVVVSLNEGEPQYDHGNATLDYTITATNPQGSWRFDFANTAVAGYSWGAPTVQTGTATVSGSTVTVTEGTSVTLRFVVDNGNTYTNANDAAGDAADFSSEITISTIQSGSGWSISDNGTGSKDATTAVSRPHTTTITAE